MNPSVVARFLAWIKFMVASLHNGMSAMCAPRRPRPTPPPRPRHWNEDSFIPFTVVVRHSCGFVHLNHALFHLANKQYLTTRPFTWTQFSFHFILPRRVYKGLAPLPFSSSRTTLAKQLIESFRSPQIGNKNHKKISRPSILAAPEIPSGIQGRTTLEDADCNPLDLDIKCSVTNTSFGVYSP